MRQGRNGARRARHMAAACAAIVVLVMHCGTALAWQPRTPEEELAERFAPVIILQRQDAPCDEEGEPYLPAPVDVVFADPAVVLREGPRQEAVESPIRGGGDLFALGDDYATDLPGYPRDPGCDYETHFKAVMGDQTPVIYAHVATEEGVRGIALQYWFFYYFNDFNNKHEGDWEMIQLLFDAATVEEALTQEPILVAFAQHDNGELSDWDAPKLERDGLHPVVYASSGSHASYFGPGLWLGWGREGSGLGCDITNGEPVRIEPEVRLIPDTISGPDDPFAWATFAGRWGERETWVYNGPTGPALKPRWTAPVSWMDELRSDAIRVKSAALLGPAPSDIFCDVVENASLLLTYSKPYPWLVVGIVGVGLAVVALAVRLAWPALRGAWRVYRPHLRVFAGIGGITVPATLVVSVVQYLLANDPRFSAWTGLSEDSPELLAALSGVSLLQQALLFLVVTPAVIVAVGEIARGQTPTVRRSLRVGITRAGALIWTFLRGTVVLVLLLVSIIGIPWAINRSVRWLFSLPATVLEGVRGKEALDISSAAVKGGWWQVAASEALLGFSGSAPGVLLALALMVLAQFPVDAANAVAALVYAVAHPFAIAGLAALFLSRKAMGDG